MKEEKQVKFGGIVGAVLVAWLIVKFWSVLGAITTIVLGLIALGAIVLIVAIVSSGLKSGSGKKDDAGVKTETETKEATSEQKKALNISSNTSARIRVDACKVKDVEIRNEFSILCDKADKVIKALKQSPEDFYSGRRICTYYLSSILEILNKYLKLQASGVDMEDTKVKLRSSLKEINEALDKLYNKLYDNDKLDLTVDMKALSVALKRDGLIDESFAKAAEDFSLGNADSEEMLNTMDLSDEEKKNLIAISGEEKEEE